MAMPSIKFLYGNDSSKLLAKNESGNYDIGLTPGAVYFSADGKIIWDWPTTTNLTKRVVMGNSEIITKTINTEITLNNSTWTTVSTLNSIEFSDTFQDLGGGGTFALQIHVGNAIDIINNITQYNTFHSGIVSWYWGNGAGIPDNVSTTDEVLLHRSGMVMQDIVLYAQISKSQSEDSVLQLKSNTNLTIPANNLTIRLRQLI